MRPLRTLELGAAEWKCSSAGNSDGQPVGNTRILAGVLGLNLAPSFHRLLHVSGCDDGARVHLTNSSLTNSAPGLGHPDKIKARDFFFFF